MNYTAKHPEDLAIIAKHLLQQFQGRKIYIFNGDMGSGKTTFIKYFCAELGVKDAMSSPTFSIVNEYRGKNGMVYHFDLYRLKDLNEAIDLGIEDYIYSQNYCFIEWPALILQLLPEDVVTINIAPQAKGRLIHIQ